MTGRKKGDDLAAALGNLRKERGGESPASAIENSATPAAPAPKEKEREGREAFTSRLRPSQRRWLKRWAADLEEETDRRVTVEDVLEAFLTEAQESEALRARVVARLARDEE